MKHGVAFRKLSRGTAHRMLMLRNLVTSLIEHEQIQTTLAKAKETSRLAEKLITLGKKGSPKCKSSAQGMLLDQTLVPKVFQELALRYKDRQGGYTRINKFGRREGDNAPSAIIELVDGPRDTLFEVTARVIGWEIMGHKLKCSQLRSHAMDDLEAGVDSINVDGTEKWLRPITRENIQKVLLHRGEEGKKLLGQKAAAYLNQLLAEPHAHEGLKAYFREREEEVSKEAPKGKKFTEQEDRDGSKRASRNTLEQDKQTTRKIWERPVGAVPAGSAATAIGLSYGALGKKRPWQVRRTTTVSRPPAITKVKSEQATA